jgi:hypothetical protein
MLPCSLEVLTYLLTACRNGDKEAQAELERLHEPLLQEALLELRGPLHPEQLEVCCRFALQRAFKAYDPLDAEEGLTLAGMARDWMRLEVEETVRSQRWSS